MDGSQNRLERVKPAATGLPGQVVLVLQGGGALGSYQAGVYQALHEAGIEPDWIIGTSIGAINASLIAGNEPALRLDRLREFWKRMEQKQVWNFHEFLPGFNEKLSYWSTVTHGIAGFFRPQNFLHSLYVDARGAGVGKALLDHVAAQTDGPLSLKVQAPNLRAQAFYRREGFFCTEHGRDPGSDVAWLRLVRPPQS